MTTYRAASINDCVFTGQSQAHLSDAELIEAAVAEGYENGGIGSNANGGWETEEDFRAALTVGDWTEGSDDERPAPVAAGYVVIDWEREPGNAEIWGSGRTVAAATAAACSQLADEGWDPREDGEAPDTLPRGFHVVPCTQAVLDCPDAHPLWAASATDDGVSLIDLAA